MAIASHLSACSKSDTDMKIIYTLPDGTRTSDVNQTRGVVAKYEGVVAGTIPAEARRLHEEGRELGGKQDYVAAAVRFERASSLAPDWAYPKYDLAYTRLLMGDAKEALRLYKEVDSLKPRGFFTTKTAIWTLEREANGGFQEHTYVAYLLSEGMPKPQKRDLMLQITRKVPAFAPAWKELSFLEEDVTVKDEYLARALSLNPDADTYGMCTINLASRTAMKGDIEEARRILTDLIADEKSTSGTVALAKDLWKLL